MNSRPGNDDNTQICVRSQKSFYVERRDGTHNNPSAVEKGKLTFAPHSSACENSADCCGKGIILIFTVTVSAVCKDH